jgi:hypothetical protein
MKLNTHTHRRIHSELAASFARLSACFISETAERISMKSGKTEAKCNFGSFGCSVEPLILYTKLM